jgi:LysM repeat protein
VKMMTVVLLAGALTLIGCNNMQKDGDRAPPPPTLQHTQVARAPAPAPRPMATVSPMPAASVSPVPAATVSPVPAAPVPTDVVAGGKVYVLKKGDTLARIAREQLGGLSNMHDLINANPGIDPNTVYPGQEINLP